MSEPPRVAVFAYSDVGHACLRVLLERGCHVVAVITHEDDPRETRWFPSVAELAQRQGVPVVTPEKIFRAAHADWWREAVRPAIVFSFYYRRMLPMWLLEAAPLGAFNLHGSLLPRYRGRAPVNWAVLHGESETGATLHHMVSAPDAGDIVDQQAVPIGPDDTAIEVMGRVRDAGAAVLARQLDALLAGAAPRATQDESRATYFGGRRPEDGRVNWQQSARVVHNLVRAVTRPYPGAFCDKLFPGERCFIWRTRVREDLAGTPGQILTRAPLVVAAGEGAVELLDFTRSPCPRGNVSLHRAAL